MQTGSEMCVNLVLMLYDEIVEELDKKGNEAKLIKPLYEKAKESFVSRVQLDKYYLASAILDPAQVQLPIVGRYLSNIEKTFISILTDVSDELKLENPQETTQDTPAGSSTQDFLVNISRKTFTFSILFTATKIFFIITDSS